MGQNRSEHFATLVVNQFDKLSDLASELAEAIAKPGVRQLEAAVRKLLEIAIEVGEAEVISCRLVGRGEFLDLIDAELWADGVRPVGKVAKRKHQDDCRPDLVQVDGRRRDRQWDITAESRGIYEPEHLEHFRWLGSEAFIPLVVDEHMCKAIIVLGHSSPDHFDPAKSPDRIEQLQGFHRFISSFFALADLVDDRIEKSNVLQETAKVLPMIVASPTRLSFARAICALLTCEYGFGFERAMFFWMKDGRLPAECEMAIGGTGGDWPEKLWKALEQLKPPDDLKSLADFVQSAIEHPIPDGTHMGLPDPLYACTCGHPDGFFLFDDEEGRALLTEMHQQQARGRDVPRISARNASPGAAWLSKIEGTRSGVFCSGTDEYFVFVLQPFGANDEAPPLGFIIADLAYRRQRHTPGLGNPDLVMTQFALNLVAGLWRFREDSQTYFHALAAWPILRHYAPELVNGLRVLRNDAEAGELDNEKLIERITKAEEIATELSQIKDVVEAISRGRKPNQIVDISLALELEISRAKKKHREALKVNIVSHDITSPVRISPDSFGSIVESILDNAVHHGCNGADVTVRVCEITMPGVKGKPIKRLKIAFTNANDRIEDEMIPYLFVDGITTDPNNGQGSGLSSARRIAQAHGGDVVLIQSSPVRFAVILEPDAVEQP